MRTFAVILTIVGASLLLIAFHSAEQIPRQANIDFREKQSELALKNSDSACTFMQMQSQRRLLQNLYMGSAGLILLAQASDSTSELA